MISAEANANPQAGRQIEWSKSLQGSLLAKAAILAIFSAWTLVVGAAHEPWGDEAQAWLLARDSGLTELLFERVRYEGSPGLWHAILWILMRCGVPYSSLYLISTSFAIAGAAIVLFRAPFPFWMRVGIVFSYFYAYQFAIVARSYSVDLFLFPLAAMWFTDRATAPLRYALTVGLIANLNAHSFLVASVLGIELLCTMYKSKTLFKPLNLFAILSISALGCFALFSSWQPADNDFIRPEFEKSFSTSLIFFIREAFINRILVMSRSENLGVDAVFGFIVTIFFLRTVLKLFWKSEMRAVLFGIFLSVVFFSAYTYASPWHSGILYLYVIFGLWIVWSQAEISRRKPILIGFALVSITQTAQAIGSGLWDYSHTYSPGRYAAEFVSFYKKQWPDKKVHAFGFKVFAAQPWLTHNHYDNYHGGAPRPAYVRWDKAEKWKSWYSKKIWKSVLADNPDVIVASATYFGTKPQKLIKLACTGGYVPLRKFPGHTIWRNAAYEDDTIFIFERSKTSRCEKRSA